jgi:hypothetical protein
MSYLVNKSYNKYINHYIINPNKLCRLALLYIFEDR